MAVSATLNFRSDEAKATISAWGMHIDFGPDVAFGRSSRSSSPSPTSTNGMSVVAGGAGGLPRALAAVARSAGADPHFGRPPGISCHDREFRAGWLPHLGTKCDLRLAGDEPCEASSEGEKATCIATTLM